MVMNTRSTLVRRSSPSKAVTSRYSVRRSSLGTMSPSKASATSFGRRASTTQLMASKAPALRRASSVEVEGKSKRVSVLPQIAEDSQGEGSKAGQIYDRKFFATAYPAESNPMGPLQKAKHELMLFIRDTVRHRAILAKTPQFANWEERIGSVLALLHNLPAIWLGEAGSGVDVGTGTEDLVVEDPVLEQELGPLAGPNQEPQPGSLPLDETDITKFLTVFGGIMREMFNTLVRENEAKTGGNGGGRETNLDSLSSCERNGKSSARRDGMETCLSDSVYWTGPLSITHCALQVQLEGDPFSH